MRVRLTHIDGKLPNLALMRLGAYHVARGDEVHFRRTVYRDLFEPPYDRVYGSAIFTFSQPCLDTFRRQFPGAIIGGTGSGSNITLEEVVARIPERYDYRFYSDFTGSIGFLQRGCRLKCPFCIVPQKEGRPRPNMRVADLWRGDPHPRNLHLLDNDFFGVPEWRQHIEDIRSGGFRVCLNQGINVRMITEEAARALASIEYRDDQFRRRRLYTAWDNLGDERVFFRGVDRLNRAGIPSKHIMAYMLVGYDPDETWSKIDYRFRRMVDRDIRPYAMVYDRSRKDLLRFARWCNLGLYRKLVTSFEDYDP